MCDGLAGAYLSPVPTDPNYSTGSNCTNSAATDPACYRYIPIAASSGAVNCNTNNPPISYHLGAILEDNTNSALSQDADAAVNLAACSDSVSGPDFNGNTTNCSGSSVTSPDACYDETP